MLDVFSNSNGDSRLLRNVIPLILDRRFKNTGSKITTMNKDINIAQNLAKNLGIELPVLNLSKKLFRKGKKASLIIYWSRRKCGLLP